MYVVSSAVVSPSTAYSSMGSAMPVTLTAGYDAAVDSARVMAASLHAELLRRSATIGTAESLTGGVLGSLMTATPGASETYRGGVVAYATAVKRDVLGVSDETLQEYGAISAECAAEMASGVLSLVGADYAVSTTGVAGPAEQEGKPVGLVYIAIAGPGSVSTRELQLDGDREQIRAQACVEALLAALVIIVEAGD